jgi:hypothetical protein
LLKSPNNYLSNTKLASIVKSNGVDAQTEEEFRIIKDLLNWIEDRRIDYKIYTNAPGYRMYYEAMYNKYFNDKIIDKALISGEMNKETWEGYMFHVINFTNPMRQLNALTQLRNIWDTIDLRNIERLQTTEDALKIAGDVFSIIKTAIAENADSAEAQKPAPSDNMQPGSGNEEDGMSNGNKDADDDSDNTAPGSNLSPRDLEKLEKAIDAQRKFLRDEVQKKGKLTKSGAAIVNAMRESGTEVRDVYTNTAGDAGKVSTIVIKKLTPGIICSIPDLFENASADMINGRVKLDAGTWNTKSIVKNQEAVMRGIVLGRQLGNKLQLRNADRTLKTTRLQTGKIDRRLVAQLGYDNVNVFHRIVTDKYKNYFIHISIDASGSMSGCKWWQSITSAVAIAQAASMTTGIRVQISLRGTKNIGGGSEKCVTIYVYDSAHDKINKITNYFKYLTTFGCTPEGLAFKSIEKDIKSDARGDELIFINYSDGAPSPVHGAHCTYNGINFTRKIINDFRSTGINIISYFINAGSVWESDRREFTTMYGSDSKFINPESMLEISKSINAKFLEMAE